MQLNQNAPAAPAPKGPMGAPLPAYLNDELSKLRAMTAGNGVNDQIYKVVLRLLAFRSDEETFATVAEATANCGRDTSREIRNAINRAKPNVWQGASSTVPFTGGTAVPKAVIRPTVNEEQRAAVIAEAGPGFELADLWGASQAMLPECSTEDVIDALFPGNPLLCVGRNAYTFRTRPREDWRGQLAAMQLIVPSPMSAVSGITQEGKLSEHCLANTGPRRFMVVECDRGTVDEQAAILWHLRSTKGLPLVLACHSGGKSLHGWFYCEGVPEAKIEAIYAYCTMLGADPKTKLRSQFVRMPDGLRDTGARQTIYYFDPTVLPNGGQPQ